MEVNPQPSIYLVGGPLAVIESNPGTLLASHENHSACTGVFTSLTRRLGIHGLELVEMYDIEPWDVDHLHPHGLIFCFMWRKDAHRPRTLMTPLLSDDVCATHAILNVLLNCPGIDLGEELRGFGREMEEMLPTICSCCVVIPGCTKMVPRLDARFGCDRLPNHTHNTLSSPVRSFFAFLSPIQPLSLTRISDICASLNTITITTSDNEKRKEKERKAGAKLPSRDAC
ncbi:hypothetical protein GALMADRAFT_259728 [Galerina marginata CBS 339.88]|uniref:ubiquitinyl hydrolase 1 n=1 Tax=Galerina marginata (strain CBS 339.88) TaxID=685588 RepID=A0A067S5V0_GALM3|nr:hypothetical protein GALMADRAFT_259728 [Galerina marginata CBS 339.88]